MPVRPQCPALFIQEDREALRHILIDLLRRPGVSYAALAPCDPERPPLPSDVCEQVEIAAKYEGYIARADAERAAAQRAEDVLLPEDIDYLSLEGLRIEARQKLAARRPRTLGQAGRLEGVNPADTAALMLYLEQRRRYGHDDGGDS